MIPKPNLNWRNDSMNDIHLRYETPGAKPLTDLLRGVLDDDAVQALRERNAQRVAQAKAALGDRWIGAKPVTRRDAQ